ncbi:efflux RND transporter permease subunit, partial [Rhizobium ruizarguesonis]
MSLMILRKVSVQSSEWCAVLMSAKTMRPIIMTSLAFILGVVPLANATGAGSAA